MTRVIAALVALALALPAGALDLNDPYYKSKGSWGQKYRDQWGLHKIEVRPDK